MDRREALKTMAATVALTGCDRDETAGQPAPRTEPIAVASASPSAPTRGPVQAVESLTGPPWQTLDPFLFCVHHDDAYPAANAQMGPKESLAGRNLGQDFGRKDGWSMYHGRVVPGFPQHPHRGFETVTVVRKGLIDHADSLGATARYGGGDVQWLTAGRGIQHAEMFPLLDQAEPNPLELFQIWLNLPKADKMVEPHFTMLWHEKIPEVVTKSASGATTQVTVVAGSYREHTPPSPPPSSYASKATADVAIWTVRMEPGATWELPAGPAGVNRALYFFLGSQLRVAGRAIERGKTGQRLVLDPTVAATLEAGADGAGLLLLQGRPIGEPVAKYGPFVMNTQQEIQQAYSDFRQTRFGGWPWDRSDPVHERGEGRFAKHVGGRIERPT